MRSCGDSQGRSCGLRRFWVAARFDLPLELQTPDLTSRVLNTATDDQVFGALRQADTTGACDCFVAERGDPRWVPAFERKVDAGSLDRAGQTIRYVVYAKSSARTAPAR